MHRVEFHQPRELGSENARLLARSCSSRARPSPARNEKVTVSPSNSSGPIGERDGRLAVRDGQWPS